MLEFRPRFRVQSLGAVLGNRRVGVAADMFSSEGATGMSTHFKTLSSADPSTP